MNQGLGLRFKILVSGKKLFAKRVALAAGDHVVKDTLESDAVFVRFDEVVNSRDHENAFCARKVD